MRKGEEAKDQIDILGDDAVPIDYHVDYWKREIVDFIILQQDAFDKIDANCPVDRQKYMLGKVVDVCDKEFDFEEFEEVSRYFKKVIDLFRQINYSPFQEESFKKYEKELEGIINEKILENA